MADSPSRRVLRSACRSHGTNTCTCQHEELPETPRRRSLSRTPSRAASMVPEMLLHPLHEKDEEFFKASEFIQSEKRGNGIQKSRNVRAASEQDRIYVDGQSVTRMDSYARSGNNVIRTSDIQTNYTSSSFQMNGHKERARQRVYAGENGHIHSISTINSTSRNLRGYRDESLGKRRHLEETSHVVVQWFDKVTRPCITLMHYVLMNLFVFEKWLLHRGERSSDRYWKPLLLLLLLLLTGWCLWSFWRLLFYPVEALTYGVGAVLQTIAAGLSSGFTWFTRPSVVAPPLSSEPRGYFDSSALLTRIGKLEERMDAYSSDLSVVQANYERYSLMDEKIADLQKTISVVRASVQAKADSTVDSGNYQVLLDKVDTLAATVQENRRVLGQLKASKTDWKSEQETLQRIESLDKLVREMQNTAPVDTHPDLNALLIKLQTKIDVMELSFNDQYFKLAAQLNAAVSSWQLKLEDEIIRVETDRKTDTLDIKARLDVIEPQLEYPRDADPEVLGKSLLPIILPTIMENVHQVLSTKSKECEKQESAGIIVGDRTQCDCRDMEKMIKAAIAKYDADKTGLPDVALEPAGGSILSTRCTKSSRSKNSVLTLWGWRLWSYSNTPRSIIQPGVVPGDCWAVEGATAEVVIQLISPTVISGFSLEHIPKSISPYGKIDTAPRRFEVVGLMSEHDIESIWNYGSYEYEDNNEPLQYFKVHNFTKTAYPIVELRVLSNHGNVKSTCIYRFRVHGEMKLVH